MADERKYYVLCQSNCKFESMTKEQILTAIEQAVTTGTISDVDAGFITRLVEQNGNKPVKIWVGTQAQYNALTEKDDDTLYITDDANKVDTLENIVYGILADDHATVKRAQCASAFEKSGRVYPFAATAANFGLYKGDFKWSMETPIPFKPTAENKLVYFPDLNVLFTLGSELGFNDTICTRPSIDGLGNLQFEQYKLKGTLDGDTMYYRVEKTVYVQNSLDNGFRPTRQTEVNAGYIVVMDAMYTDETQV